MMAAERLQDLIDRLPPLAGRVEAGAALSPATWFRTGSVHDEIVRQPQDDLFR